MFLVNSYRNIAWFRERITGESQLMLFRRIMGTESSRIKLPYWAIPEEYEYSDKMISIPWYDGDRESVLEISEEDESIYIKSPQVSYGFDDLSIASVKHILDEKNNILEISVIFRDETIPMRFRFSGFGVSAE